MSGISKPLMFEIDSFIYYSYGSNITGGEFILFNFSF